MSGLQDNLSVCVNRIKALSANRLFTGETAESVKAYMSEVHGLLLGCLHQMANQFEMKERRYLVNTFRIDEKADFVLPENTIRRFSDNVSKNANAVNSYSSEINRAMDRVSYILGREQIDCSGIRAESSRLVRSADRLCQNIQMNEHEAAASLAELDRYITLFENCVREMRSDNYIDMYHYIPGYLRTPRVRMGLGYLQDRYLYEHIIVNYFKMDIEGKIVIDIDLMKEFMVRPIDHVKIYEQAAILKALEKIRLAAALYEYISKIGVIRAGIDLLSQTRWLINDTTFDSFAAVSAHFSGIFLDLLNFIYEKRDDALSFAANLISFGVPGSVINLIGVETENNIKDIFGKNKLAGFIAKYKSVYSEQYFAKLEASEKKSLKTELKSVDFKDYLNSRMKDAKARSEYKNKYFSDGHQFIDEKNAPAFYKDRKKVAEFKENVGVSAAFYEGEFENHFAQGGSVAVDVGKAEAHASVAGGLYSVSLDGKRKFSPGLNAEIGASATALKVDWDQQWFGDKNLGISSNVTGTAGKVEAKGDLSIGMVKENGKTTFQANAGASAEAIAGEIEGKADLNVLGGSVGVKGSVNLGLGAHANVGYKNGVFKFDVGASVGIGFSAGFEIDVGGIVNTVVDSAKSAWKNIAEGWSNFFGWNR